MHCEKYVNDGTWTSHELREYIIIIFVNVYIIIDLCKGKEINIGNEENLLYVNPSLTTGSLDPRQLSTLSLWKIVRFETAIYKPRR